MRHEISVLLADGQKLHFTQREHESKAEFDGLVLCRIEEAITGERKTPPKGTRWVEWWHHGHPIRSYYPTGLGTLYESTGEPYVNRRKRIPGLYSEDEARAVLEIEHER